MRQKTRPSTRRRRRPERLGGAGQDPAEWVLVNETGWGMPHYLVAVIAALFVLARVVGWLLGGRGPDADAGDTAEDRPPG
jgi:hypothetical protein